MTSRTGEPAGMASTASIPASSSPVPLMRSRQIPHPERALARGELVLVRRGVYAPAPAWRDSSPWDRYLARVHATALVYPDAVFCHDSAAALHGLPVFGDPGIVHVLQDPAITTGTIAGVRIHASAVPREVSDLDAVAVTSPAETAVDIARTRQPALALSVADAVLRLDPRMTVERLVAVNESRASSRGRRQARWPLQRATPLAESTLESISRAAVEWLGYPEPELQHWFTSASGERDRADMWWPGARVVGEADGDLKYDGRFGDPLLLLRARRRRDARLREHVRGVAHWAWDEVVAFPALRGILSGAGLRRIRPEDTARLLELRRALTAP